jgi:hypothetical protein
MSVEPIALFDIRSTLPYPPANRAGENEHPQIVLVEESVISGAHLRKLDGINLGSYKESMSRGDFSGRRLLFSRAGSDAALNRVSVGAAH